MKIFQKPRNHGKTVKMLNALAWPEIAKDEARRNEVIDELIAKLPKKYTDEDMNLFEVFKKLGKMTDEEITGELAYDRAVDDMRKILEGMKNES